MKCLHCGYCCLNMLLVTVTPEAVTDLVIDELTEDMALVVNTMEDGILCPHLSWNTEFKFSCEIHHRAWFDDTPCGKHSQIETGDKPCRTGAYMMDKNNADTHQALVLLRLTTSPKNTT
jgi:hypothetical protein